MRFPDLTPGKWQQHAADVCTKCGEARFERRQTANGTVLVPRKVFYWFGLANVIRDRLFTDPSWCKRRGTGRHEYFYCTAESARLHSTASCNPLDKDTSVYEVGLDWGQVFVNKVHSCGFIMVRCAHVLRRGHCNLGAACRTRRARGGGACRLSVVRHVRLLDQCRGSVKPGPLAHRTDAAVCVDVMLFTVMQVC
jgi:hypothetical protein